MDTLHAPGGWRVTRRVVHLPDGRRSEFLDVYCHGRLLAEVTGTPATITERLSALGVPVDRLRGVGVHP